MPCLLIALLILSGQALQMVLTHIVYYELKQSSVHVLYSAEDQEEVLTDNGNIYLNALLAEYKRVLINAVVSSHLPFVNNS
jgi:hypothetical protein